MESSFQLLKRKQHPDFGLHNWDRDSCFLSYSVCGSVLLTVALGNWYTAFVKGAKSTKKEYFLVLCTPFTASHALCAVIILTLLLPLSQHLIFSCWRHCIKPLVSRMGGFCIDEWILEAQRLTKWPWNMYRMSNSGKFENFQVVCISFSVILEVKGKHLKNGGYFSILCKKMKDSKTTINEK